MDEADLAVVGLVAALRIVPTDVLAVVAGLGGRTRAGEQIGRLIDRGLLGRASLATRPGRSPALVYVADCGASALAAVRGEDVGDLVRRLGLSGRELRKMVLRLPEHLGCCRLLAYLTLARSGPVSHVRWERPAPLTYPARTGEGTGVVRLPALVELAWGTRRGAYLLVPDDPAVPPRVFRPALAGLARRRAAGVSVPPIVVGVEAGARAGAWCALVDEVAHTTGMPPLSLHVVRVDELPPLADAGVGRGQPRGTSQLRLPSASPSACLVDTPFDYAGLSPRERRRPEARALHLDPADRALLDTLGRHSFKTVDELAALHRWSRRWTRQRRAKVVRLGLAASMRQGQRAEGVLTADGQRITAAWHGLTPGQAARHLGLVCAVGTGERRPRAIRDRTYRELARNHAHTVEADVFVLDLVADARRAAPRGEEPLVEWRNSVQCARGRLRPDGYVVLRHGGRVAGYMVEYDRGTENGRQLEAKFERYYRFRDEETYRRDYDGFPTILVVAAAYEAMKRIADVLRALAIGREPLPVLLTTAELASRDPACYMGGVWFASGSTEGDLGWRRRGL